MRPTARPSISRANTAWYWPLRAAGLGLWPALWSVPVKWIIPTSPRAGARFNPHAKNASRSSHSHVGGRGKGPMVASSNSPLHSERTGSRIDNVK